MSKKEETTGSKELTLKDIEEHLKRQDRQIARWTNLSSYQFGAMLVFIAFGLLAGKYILTIELWYAAYAIVLLIGGTGIMLYAWHKRK